MISSAELAGLRDVVVSVLPDLCTVRRPGTPVSDGAGGWTSTIADVPGLVSVPCAVAPGGTPGQSTTERVQTSRIVAAADWVITFGGGVDVSLDDQVVVTVVDQAQTRTFDVVAIGGPRSNEVSRRVGAREVSA